MANPTSSTQMENKKTPRVILFPLPLQGCINPMLQLAKILYSNGFSITLIHTRLNSPDSSNHPHFRFIQISDGLSETEASTPHVMSLSLLSYVNAKCVSPFRDCLAQLLSDDETIKCLIDDLGWTFTQTVADGLKLPRIVLQTYKASWFLAHTILPVLREKPYLPLLDSEAESPVLEIPPLKMKDLLPILAEDPVLLDPSLVTIVKATKASSGVIFNSSEELEQDALSRAREEFQVPIFPIGPFPIWYSASSGSLLRQDESCLSWLDKHAPSSVIYVSFGSVAMISETEFMEIAWGLSNSNQPFLWVVRPGLVRGSEWMEPLPRGLIESLTERGKIVKWAPQQEVLAHPATGAFWTHNGWNSTLESICEGVPMICQPCGWDQMLNARYVSDVWMVGLHLENRIEREGIQRAIEKIMVGKEGQEILERINLLKEKMKKCLEPGGSSYQSLEKLIDRLLSF